MIRDTLKIGWTSHDERWSFIYFAKGHELVILLIDEKYLSTFATKLNFQVLF